MRTWVALLDAEPAGAERSCTASTYTGEPVVLASWTAARAPHPRALAVDPRALGAGGPAMQVSWVELPGCRRPLFDAPEVLEARRRLLRQWPTYGASSLLADASRLAGSVVLGRPGERVDDPFSRIGPHRLLQCAGFFRPIPRPTGPSVERYAGMPWPFDRFPEGTGSLTRAQHLSAGPRAASSAGP